MDRKWRLQRKRGEAAIITHKHECILHILFSISSVFHPKNKRKLNVSLLSGQVELDNAFQLNPEAPPDEEVETCPESPPPPTPTCAKINKTSKVSVTFPHCQETIARELLISYFRNAEKTRKWYLVRANWIVRKAHK